MKKRKGILKRGAASAILVVMTAAMLLSGCNGGGNKKIKLDPGNPVTITVWHYYNGPILNAFDMLIRDFNETVGADMGIIVEGSVLGNVSELESAVLSSANKEVGSREMPNIFASYADTAYEAEKMDLLANLDDYFTEDELKEYIDSYIEEGKIGLEGERRIFPIAKSTETLMINETDWLPFAQDTGFTYDDLATMEGVTKVAEAYYNWTDAKTPGIPNDGKSFFGRDSTANLFIIGSKEFGTEIFKVSNGVAEIVVNEEAMRKIWDNHYVPFIKGYFSAYGRYRSDDAKVGDIIAYVGSTSSAAYLPSEVTSGGSVYPVTAKVLPAPYFDGAQQVIVQQGAGMVITKSTPQEEYASAVFLKWFTETKNNIDFAALSGYMPVKKEANSYDKFLATLTESGQVLDVITEETLKVAFGEMAESEMYTNKAFTGGAKARSVLDASLPSRAIADREAILQMLESGSTWEEAVAQFDTEENFQAWLADFSAQLYAAAEQE